MLATAPLLALAQPAGPARPVEVAVADFANNDISFWK
jgi:hypothetical protein